MEYTNDNLKKLWRKKIKYNHQYSLWYYRLHQEYNKNFDMDTGEIIPLDDELFNNRYLNKSDRIDNCMNLWQWDAYHKNKLLDLQRVNRCGNNRFCPNCKVFDISKFIINFRQVIEKLGTGYKLYMLTLTVPNCIDIELEPTLRKLSKKFHALIQKYSSGSLAYKNRLFDIVGGVKVLEITYNQAMQTYHPHYHCIVMLPDTLPTEYFDKQVLGKYSNKRKETDLKSIADCEIGQIWSMLYQDIKVNDKNIQKYKYIPSAAFLDQEHQYQVLEVDLRELDESGMYEVFKYTFKDLDIVNYHVFATLEKALASKRIRQGFGMLYNLKCEDVEVGEQQGLNLGIEESPENLLTKEISELFMTYQNYEKISRFNHQLDNNIKE